MLTSKRFAFMFKPLPVKSKTERKQNHTDTQNHIVITTQFQKNWKRTLHLLFRCCWKSVSNIWYFLLDPTIFYCPPIARAIFLEFCLPALPTPFVREFFNKTVIRNHWLRYCPIVFINDRGKRVRKNSSSVDPIEHKDSNQDTQRRSKMAARHIFLKKNKNKNNNDLCHLCSKSR